jgi:TPR repeat protein
MIHHFLNPLRVAEIAESLDRNHDVHKWLTKAAEAGDTEAMRRLIEEFDQDNLQRCWSWVYLAQLLDTDLTRDDYYAIHEDGSHYDDDVGGAMYVDGRDGVKLPKLSADQDAFAREAAKELFEKMQ